MKKYFYDLSRMVIFTLALWVASMVIPFLGSASPVESLHDKLWPVGLVLLVLANIFTIWTLFLILLKVFKWLTKQSKKA